MVGAAGVPLEVELARLERHGNLGAQGVNLGSKLVKVSLANLLRSGQQEFVPEERLQTVEVEAVVLEEAQLAVLGLDILFVQTVDDEHIVGGKLHAAHLGLDERYHHLQTDYLILAHAQLARQRLVDASRLDAEAHVAHNVLLVEPLIAHLLHEMQRGAHGVALLHGSLSLRRAAGHHCLLGTTRCQHESHGKERGVMDCSSCFHLVSFCHYPDSSGHRSASA